MNITREKTGELDLCIKMEIAESDYAEKVAKQLKEYRQKATVPGFRKGMAPMGLIERMYKSALTADVVQNLMGESLYKYIDDEKLDIMGSPLANDEKNGTPDFGKGGDFTFCFDAALMPEVKIDWEKIDTKLCSIKVSAKEIDTQVKEIAQRFGKFEAPEVVGEGDFVYGKIVELAKDGSEKEGGVSTFTSFNLSTLKDPEMSSLFVGHKAEDKIVFNPAKAFAAAEIERALRIDAAAAKKFKSDVEFTLSGCSHVIPAEMNEELFEKVFPGEGIKDAAAFRKAVGRQIEEANDEQCHILYVNQVRKQLLDNFDAPMPEAFLKRWILSRSEKDLTAEKLDEEWNDKYMPSLKWEILDAALNKIQSIEPTQNEIVDEIKSILKKNDILQEGEDEKKQDERLEQSARSIAADRANVQQIVDRLYVNKTFDLFKAQAKPETEKISAKEFGERAKSN